MIGDAIQSASQPVVGRIIRLLGGVHIRGGVRFFLTHLRTGDNRVGDKLLLLGVFRYNRLNDKRISKTSCPLLRHCRRGFCFF
jgi:hypothetical protein